jgi:trypsin
MRPLRAILAGLALACTPLLSSPAAHADPEARMSVVGGYDASAANWPFMAGLVHAGNPDTFQAQFCGGTLVSRQAVLTAAHCVSGMAPTALQIVTGTRLSMEQPRLAVHSIAVHPSYTGALTVHDLAVLTLAQPHGLQTINLAIPGDDGDGQPASLAGWGNLVGGGSNLYSEDLQQGDLFLGGPRCAGSPLAGSPWALCAASASTLAVSPCVGDSGGPLVSRGRLLGVISSGPVHCQGESYYARVSGERAFLDAAIAAADSTVTGTGSPAPPPVPAPAPTPAPTAAPAPVAPLFLTFSEARSVTRRAARRVYRATARSIVCTRRSATRVRCRFSVRRRGRTLRRGIEIREWAGKYTFRITR